jgi:hypothetical protein
MNPNFNGAESFDNAKSNEPNNVSNGSGIFIIGESKFASPEEEINYLRRQIEEKELAMKNMPRKVSVSEHASSAIKEHAEKPFQEVYQNNTRVLGKDIQEVLKSLSNKNTTKQVMELASIMQDDGLRFAIEIAEKLNKPEIEDDFHRFLVNYLLSGQENIFKSMDKAKWKAMHLKLFEIVPPPYDPSLDKKDPKQYIQLMEQLYQALQSIAISNENNENNYYSLEIAIANGSNEVIFYIAVPFEVEAILEKTLQGYFPGIEVKPKKEDYNIFHDAGYQVAAIGSQHENPILPIKTYKNIEGDPITVLINSFAKIGKEGEGAAMQLLIKPSGSKFKKEYGKILDNMQNNGDSLKKALNRETFFGGAMIGLGQAINGSVESKNEKDKTYVESERVKLISEKLSSTIVDTNLRLYTSSSNLDRAKSIMNDMKASFRQYTENNGNYIRFDEYETKNLTEKTHEFTYRLWNDKESMPLNISELATIYHVPGYVKDFVQVKTSKMVTAPAPLDLSQDGVLIGYNEFRDIKTEIHLAREDRMRHLYVLGQTGTGKTVTLKNLIIQDIKNGDGCCMIDPHGDDVKEILANVPPERYDDVIYFDPAHADRPMGLNMLEYDREFPELKTLVINEMLGIFNKLFDMKTSGGAGFEAMFRNATQLVMEHPESGNTLLEISRVLSDKDFRDYKLSKCKNPMIHQYWKNAEATTGEQGLSNWVPFINSKIDPFLTNDIMRPIVAQETSSFNIREIMDNKKILLVNLSKGRLGEINSNLLGLILIGKFAQAALARANSKDRPDFYLYLDEFQNVVTPSISSILSEARKYRLSLNIAHQFLGQLPEDIKDAVFGNVGNMAISRVGPDDAQFLEKQFAPTFTASDIMKIENLNSYVKILNNGTPQKPFSIHVPYNSRGNKEVAEQLAQLSFAKYGRPRAEVEEEIMQKYSL